MCLPHPEMRTEDDVRVGRLRWKAVCSPRSKARLTSPGWLVAVGIARKIRSFLVLV